MENLRNFKITPAKPEPTEDSPIELSPEALFTLAVKDVRPLPSDGHALLALEKPKPIPKKFRADLLLETKDTLSDHFIPAYELEGDEDLHYLRSGHSPDILNRLRKGHWPVQAAIDLHGLVSDEARRYVSTFITDCKQAGIRCVRIVHGKGLSSPNQAPVLKQKLRGWLMQKDEVIAYVQAGQKEGGSGALVVLIKA